MLLIKSKLQFQNNVLTKKSITQRLCAQFHDTKQLKKSG